MQVMRLIVSPISAGGCVQECLVLVQQGLATLIHPPNDKGYAVIRTVWTQLQDARSMLLTYSSGTAGVWGHGPATYSHGGQPDVLASTLDPAWL